MDLLCPAWIRSNRAARFKGTDIFFRRDTLGGPDRFHDRLDYRITIEETTPYHPPPGEPSRQTNQRVDSGPVGRFRAENAKLIEFMNVAGCRLPVTLPQPGEVNLGGHELPGL